MEQKKIFLKRARIFRCIEFLLT